MSTTGLPTSEKGAKKMDEYRSGSSRPAPVKSPMLPIDHGSSSPVESVMASPPTEAVSDDLLNMSCMSWEGKQSGFISAPVASEEMLVGTASGEGVGTHPGAWIMSPVREAGDATSNGAVPATDVSVLIGAGTAGLAWLLTNDTAIKLASLPCLLPESWGRPPRVSARARPALLLCWYSQVFPRFRQRTQEGFSLVHRCLEAAQL